MDSLPIIAITEAARSAGAEGIWLIRGAQTASLSLSFDAKTEQFLALTPPHELIIVLRFPSGDAGEAGIESR